MAGEVETGVLRTILTSDDLDVAQFAPGFLAAVPEAQLRTVIAGVRAQIGPVLTIIDDGQGRFTVETATHQMPAQLYLDANGKVTGLLFRPAVASSATLESAIAHMQAFAPDFSVLVTRNGEMLAAHDPDRPLAVGSAFKLGVLAALADDVSAGRRRWSDVVTLAEADKSLPSGMLQNWPAGAPFTLHSLAGLMISLSDNTATDLLIHSLGRERVEARLGIAPVLTTRELFALKADAALRDRFKAGDLAERRRVLAELAGRPLPSAGDVATPYEAALEWNLSTRQLCGLIEELATLDVLAINPGAADPNDWARIAFKGGSEIGVLNLTTALTAADGTRLCVSATWNAAVAIDEGGATSAYAGLLAVLRRG